MAVKSKPKMPDVETVRMPLAMLLPADYNPRRISDRAMKGLRASLERFGELGGIVYNKRSGSLVGGHQRVKALAAMGIEDAEHRVVDLPVAEEKAANLALNHPGIGGEWDDALLAVVLDEVKRDLPTAFEELHSATSSAVRATDLSGSAAGDSQTEESTSATSTFASARDG
jgi:ParB-like chromosome segregation protein Spo0J